MRSGPTLSVWGLEAPPLEDPQEVSLSVRRGKAVCSAPRVPMGPLPEGLWQKRAGAGCGFLLFFFFF